MKNDTGEHGELRDRLRALREPEEGASDAAFAAALHRRLAAAGPPDPLPFWRRLWPPAAVDTRVLWPALGAVALVLVLGVALWQRPQRWPSGVATLLPATKVAMVRVNLSAEVAVASAQIRVSLPEGLVFWADGQELADRSFEWSQPLRAGDNDIPIAVRGLRPGRYRMTVTANFGKEQVSDDVLLEVTDG